MSHALSTTISSYTALANFIITNIFSCCCKIITVTFWGICWMNQYSFFLKSKKTPINLSSHYSRHRLGIVNSRHDWQQRKHASSMIQGSIRLVSISIVVLLHHCFCPMVPMLYALSHSELSHQQCCYWGTNSVDTIFWFLGFFLSPVPFPSVVYFPSITSSSIYCCCTTHLSLRDAFGFCFKALCSSQFSPVIGWNTSLKCQPVLFFLF